MTEFGADRPARSLQSPLDAAPSRSRIPAVIGGTGAALVHAILLAGAVTASSLPLRVDRPRPPQITETLIQVDPPPPPPEPPPEAAPEPPPEVTPPPPTAAKPPPRAKATRAALEVAPAAAQAAKVLEKAPEPEVLDFGDTFVQGNSESFAGGVTEAGGTSQRAVRDPNARAFGVEGGKGTARIDRSRAPMLAEGTRWGDCPFPEEADDEDVNHAVVTIRVAINASGAVDRVDVTDDPGLGFAREVKRCAMRRRWQAGLDRDGKPIAGTALLTVRFDR